MWSNLPKQQKKSYKNLITSFASLSEAFAQKSNDEDEISPIINSKFQETAFQRSFNAEVEDISNSSYDASILTDDGRKYLIGIKSFGISSGDQKIAQFKKDSVEWSETIEKLRENVKKCNSKAEMDYMSNHLYLQMAERIADLRNKRIESSRAQIRGFHDDVNVKAVYHTLMPSKKGETPQIHVGETSYNPIDKDNIQILGCTSLKNPTNFRFSDGNHVYKYTSADSQLLMSFENKEIVVDSWDVKYVDDAFKFFENLNRDGMTINKKAEKHFESYSWMLYGKNGAVNNRSAFNAFNGQSKLARKNNARQERIERINDKYRPLIGNKMDDIIDVLSEILLNNWSTEQLKIKMDDLRNKLVGLVLLTGNKDLLREVSSCIYRPTEEVYIPIPDAHSFHDMHPDFFGKDIGTFKSKSQLSLPKEKRRFTLRFIPSNEKIEAYVNQDNGKAIQSTNSQSILGEWILRQVFQLKERELLTRKTLDDLHINAIRLIKNTDDNCIDLEFIWIDENHPPKDAFGWVSHNITK